MSGLPKFGLSGPWLYLVYGLMALALIAVIVGGVRGCKQLESDADNVLVNAGITKERAETQGQVLNDVQEARNAVERPSDAERNVVCSKYDRNCPQGN